MAFSSYDKEAPKQFAQYAELCVKSGKETFRIDLHYDLESIMKLDDIVKAVGKPKDLGQMVMVIGSFLGETLRRVYNGSWSWDGNYKSWMVVLPKVKGGEQGVFPFAKVEKRFVNGMEDSISFFAKVADKIVKGELPG